MARVKRGKTSRARHKKLLLATKGFTGLNKKLVRRARETLLKAKAYEYRDRRNKKRDFRQLWTIRISAGLAETELSYSHFSHQLRLKNVQLNRKMLSYIAQEDKKGFEKIVQEAQ